MAGTIGYSPDKQQVAEDAQAMAGQLEINAALPPISDEEFADMDQYASLSGVTRPATKAVKTFIQDTLKFSHGDEVKSKIDKPVREKTGKGLETPKEMETNRRIQQQLDSMDGTVPSEEAHGTPSAPQMTPKEMIDNAQFLDQSSRVVYDENNKPSYMPRADAQATFKLGDIEGDDDVVATVQAMSEKFSGQIDEARRGVLTDDAAKGLAHDIGMDPDRLKELLTRPDGTAANVEEIYAMRNLMDQSAGRLQHLSEAVANGTASPAENVAFQEAFLFHKDLLAKFMAFRAEAGRGLRAYGVNLEGGFQTPTEQQHMLDMAMAGYDVQKIANLVQGASTKGINDAMNGLSNVRKGLDVLTTSFTYSILSGIQTQAVNVLGGVLQIGQSMADRYLTEAGTRMRILVGANTDGLIAPGEAAVYRQSLQYSIRQSVAMGAKAFKTGQNYGRGKFQQFEDPFVPSYWGMDPSTPQASLLKIWGTGTGFMVRNVMGGTDAFFKVMSENAQFMSLAYRKAWHDTEMLRKNTLGDQYTDAELKLEFQKRFEDYVENPTAEMQIEAKVHSEEMTYQDSQPLGNKWNKMIEVAPPLKFFTPFVNTPVSVVKQHLIDRTPLSLMFNGKTLASNTAEGQMARTKLAGGVTMMAGFYMMYEDGLLTGSRPSDPKEAAVWDAEGKMPNSVVISHPDGTKTYVSLHRMENFSYISSMVADISRLVQTKEVDWEIEGTDASEKVLEASALALVAIMKSMEDKTFLQGLNTLFTLTGKNSDKATIENLSRVASGIAVPTVMPLTSMQRDFITWTGSGTRKEVRGLQDKFDSSVVWLADNLSDRLDIFGEPLKDIQRGNPVKVTTVKPDVVLEEFERLMIQTNKSPVGRLPKNPFGVKLTSHEYTAMTKFVRKEKHQGKTFHDAMQMAIESDGYSVDQATPMIQVGVLQKLGKSWDNPLMLKFINDDKDLKERYNKQIELKYKRKGY